MRKKHKAISANEPANAFSPPRPTKPQPTEPENEPNQPEVIQEPDYDSDGNPVLPRSSFIDPEAVAILRGTPWEIRYPGDFDPYLRYAGHAHIPRYPGQPPFEHPTLGMNSTIPPRVPSRHYRGVNDSSSYAPMGGHSRSRSAREAARRSPPSMPRAKTGYFGLHPGPFSRYSAPKAKKGGKKGKGKQSKKAAKEKEDTEDEEEEEVKWEVKWELKEEEDLFPDSPSGDDSSDSDFKP